MCLTELPRTNFSNFDDNPVAKLFWGRIELTFGFSVYHFEKGGKLQSLMHSLKYKGKTQIGEFLGRAIGNELNNSGKASKIDLILPIPLHPKKERLRGYNQSDYLAKGIHEVTAIPYASNVVRRTMHTTSQTRKAKFDRWKNVSSIFEIHKPEQVNGKRILVVDDVTTTGSTLESCARELLNHQAAAVAVTVVASSV
ncbi:ComF family protein [Parvicella tangerina]|nr:phosphoribosyltransferase family protein [Parvicella tangerina]